MASPSKSSVGESSTLRWKRAFFVAEGRRRGRAPRGANAPGPRSSVKEERVRRWLGRPGTPAPEGVGGAEDVEGEGAGAGAGTA